MHSKLLTSFSVIALLGVSAASYASWIKYVEGDGKVPNGDCLEMICANGCVENDDFYGYCCPGNGLCSVNGIDVNECCQSGEFCDGGTCQSIRQCTAEIGGQCNNTDKCCKNEDTTRCSGGYCCPKILPSTEGASCYANCGCDGDLNCVNGVCSKVCRQTVNWGGACTDSCQCKDGGSDKLGICQEGVCCYTECLMCGTEVYCPNSTPAPEPEPVTPEEPTPASECVHLYKMGRSGGQGEDLGCCEGNLLTKTANTLFAGYKQGERTQYGCCPKDRTVGTECCPADRIYEENGKKRCCDGKVNSDKTECCPLMSYPVHYYNVSYVWTQYTEIWIVPYSCSDVAEYRLDIKRAYSSPATKVTIFINGYQGPEVTVGFYSRIVKPGDRIQFQLLTSHWTHEFMTTMTLTPL